MAVKSPDYEFILIHSAIDKPAADELLAQLRRDRRTSLLPVGFIAPLEDLPRVPTLPAALAGPKPFCSRRKKPR